MWPFTSERRRRIFRYWTGAKTRRADPIELYRKLLAHPKFTLDDLELVDKDDAEALGRVIVSVRDVFMVTPFDEGGLTELECLELLSSFINYLVGLKKNIASSPTLPVSTPVNSRPAEATSAASVSG